MKQLYGNATTIDSESTPVGLATPNDPKSHIKSNLEVVEISPRIAQMVDEILTRRGIYQAR